MNKRVVALSIAMTLLGGCNHESSPQSQSHAPQVTSADTIYFGGDILTMEGEIPQYVEAVAVLNGKIIFTGEYEKAMSYRLATTNLVDLKGKTLMPGFIDTQGQIAQYGISLGMANVMASPYGSSDDFSSLKQTLQDYIQEQNIKPGEWVVGTGYDTTVLPSHPTRQMLDEVSTEHPIVLIHASGHIGALNSKALELAKINDTTPNPHGGVIQRDGQNHPNGIIEETALWPVLLNLPMSTESDRLELLDNAQRIYASQGVTTAQDSSTTPADLDLLSSAAAKNRLFIDVITYPLLDQIGKKWQPDFRNYHHYQSNLKIGGVKLNLDGSIAGQTAYLTHPYHMPPHGEDSEYKGRPNYTDKQVKQLVKLAWDQNLQVQAHCNGDAACDQFLSAVKAIKHSTKKDWRPVMVQAQLTRPDQIKTLKALNIIPSFEMTHIYLFGDYYHDSALGDELTEHLDPAKSAFDAGLHATFHTDSPEMQPDMLMTIWSSVNRLTRAGALLGNQEKVSVYQALEAITSYAAYQNFEEKYKGTIQNGKVADFVILDKNPLKVEPTDLRDIHVETTIKDGHPIWQKMAM